MPKGLMSGTWRDTPNRAKNLLDEVNNELKLAAGAANRNAH